MKKTFFIVLFIIILFWFFHDKEEIEPKITDSNPSDQKEEIIQNVKKNNQKSPIKKNKPEVKKNNIYKKKEGPKKIENKKNYEKVSVEKIKNDNKDEEKISAIPKEEEPQKSNNITFVKVYLYEFNIDISKKEIPAGEVVFEVINSGNFTHEFSIRAKKDFGKILPKEKKKFSIYLSGGEFEIFSKKKGDVRNNMKEKIFVIN